MRFDEINQNVPFLRKDNFALAFPGALPATYSQNLKYWLKTGKLIKLKRGFYVFQDYYERCQDKTRYVEFLSSTLYQPSYISRETVLAKYGMLSEAVYGISCITKKAPRLFISKIGSFSYSRIKDALYAGFEEEEFAGSKYYLAEKSKALFDFLYFQKRKMPVVNENSVAELRLNLAGMGKADWAKYETFLAIAQSRKMDSLYRIMRRENAV